MKTAEFVSRILKELDRPVRWIFKGSFTKDNRTSRESYRGPGLEKGLAILEEVSREFKVEVLTDIHSPDQAAAAKALTVIAKDRIMVGGVVSRIDPERCTDCLGCINVCPYAAITYDPEKNIAEVNQALCKGCGACAAACPSEAPVLLGFSNQQIYAQIESALCA